MKTLITTIVVAGSVLLTATAAAQTDSARIPGDTVLERARRLVSDGREADGRRLVDSVVQANTPQNRIYAEALYVRAALSPTAAEAERDYRRLLIETPLAPRAEDATLQLANLLQARGDRRGASDLLQRFMLSYASSPARPRVSVSLVRLLFEQGTHQEARACEAFRQARLAVPRENLELRNQLDFFAPRCAMYADVGSASTATPAAPKAAETTAVATAQTTAQPTPQTTAQRTPQPTAQTARPAAPTPPARSFYSVQVAAYDSREAADRLAKLLVERGLEARVDGDVQPFRVRIGRYGTRAEAARALQALKEKGHPGFVALVNAPPR